jgi:hypothetical protein
MKVILSRKGFDSSCNAGGGSTPVLPDGRMVSLRIPDMSEVGYPLYRDLELDSDHSYLDLLARRRGVTIAVQTKRQAAVVGVRQSRSERISHLLRRGRGARHNERDIYAASASSPIAAASSFGIASRSRRSSNR